MMHGSDTVVKYLARTPRTNREQIVQFILQNTQDTAAFHNPIPVNVDPFTGAGAYVPGTAGPQPGRQGASQPSAVTGGGVDPFTGSSAAPSSSSQIPCRCAHTCTK